MTATEIKKRLISRINKSTDKDLLEDLYSLMKDESKIEILELSKQQQTAIHSAEKQISSGAFLTDAEVRKRTSTWLGK